MSAVAPRFASFVCQLCRQHQRSSKRFTILAQQPSRRIATKQRTVRPSTWTRTQTQRLASPVATLRQAHRGLAQTRSTSRPQKDVATPTFTLSSLIDEAANLEAAETAPEDSVVLELLERCHDYSNFIVFGQTEVPQKLKHAARYEEDTATASLLDLDEPSNATLQTSVSSQVTDMPASTREKAVSTVSQLTYNLLLAPNIYISSRALDLYVRIHCLLGTPQYLPQIFYLYANKPVPKPKTNPIQYTKPWPRSPKNAIPTPLADAALEAAIANKDMPLAVSIIDTTVALPAYRYTKVLRRASLPILGVCCIPFLLWQAAWAYSTWQVTWDEPMARFIVMSSSFAYVGTLGTIGFVALTTWNDHHIRVVWAPGLKLRARWLREEERLYFDRIAMAWGFKERWRRGEEQGEEWEALRELVGMRWMILDKSSFLEGME